MDGTSTQSESRNRAKPPSWYLWRSRLPPSPGDQYVNNDGIRIYFPSPQSGETDGPSRCFAVKSRGEQAAIPPSSHLNSTHPPLVTCYLFLRLPRMILAIDRMFSVKPTFWNVRGNSMVIAEFVCEISRGEFRSR